MHINVLIRNDEAGALEHRKDEQWAGVDRGAYLLLEAGIEPLFAYGDFDSVTDEEFEFIASRMDITPVPERKDDTDLEICLKDLARRGYSSINVYGATGGRLDHMLGNIFMLAHKALQPVQVSLVDRQNTMELLEAGTHRVKRKPEMKYVSFIPYLEGTRLSLDGFEYDLDGQRLEIGSTLTISNEFRNDEATVYTDRPLIMIQSRDE